MTITLYHALPSANSERVTILLFEKGLKYEKVTLSLPRKDQKRPEHLALNPYGKVPVLIEDGKVMFESCIINEYLDEKYPDPPMMPRDFYLRARARILVDYALNYLQELYWPLRGELLKNEAERDAAFLRDRRKVLAGLLVYMEDALGDKPYLVGDFSLADINVWPRLSRLEEFGVLPHPSLPGLNKWLERMKQRPSIQSIPAELRAWRARDNKVGA
jgi:glutathione S-transferase